MDSFSPEDHALVFKDLDLSGESTPTQRSLGVRICSTGCGFPGHPAEGVGSESA